jgi:CPA2 family monovalent cation:H+ antiporter-2
MILSATNFFIPIIILLGLSTISSIILSAFRLKFLPVFAVEIIIGIIIASWFNNYISGIGMAAIVDGIYVIGLSLLMFLSGYEVEFDAFRNFELNEENDCKTCKHRKCRHCKRINTFRTVILITVLTYATSILASLFLHNYLLKDKLIGIILLTLVFASTFAGFAVPIIFNEGLHGTVIGNILSAIANLSEALSILFLTILMIAVDINPKYWLVLLLIAIVVIAYRVFKKYKIGTFFGKITEGIDHLATRAIIVLILTLVLLSDLAGGEYIFGAFLAGIIVRQAKFSEKIINGLTRIIYGVFTPMFYILVGTRIDIISLVSDPSSLLLVLYVFIGLLVAELPMLLLLKWYRLNTVLPSIVLMACTVVVPIAVAHIGGPEPHGLGIFSETFGQALILAGSLICVIGAVIFEINFPFGNYRKAKAGIEHASGK